MRDMDRSESNYMKHEWITMRIDFLWFLLNLAHWSQTCNTCGIPTFDMMNLSFEASFGGSSLYFIVWKNNTDMISAALQHDVGCLE